MKQLMTRGDRRIAARKAWRSARRATRTLTAGEFWHELNDPEVAKRFARDQRRAQSRRNAASTLTAVDQVVAEAMAPITPTDFARAVNESVVDAAVMEEPK